MGFKDFHQKVEEKASLLRKGKRRRQSTDVLMRKDFTDPTKPTPLVLIEFPVRGLRPDREGKTSEEKLRFWLVGSLKNPHYIEHYKHWLRKRQIDVDVVRVKFEKLGLQTVEEVSEDGMSLILTVLFTDAQLEEEAEALGVELEIKKKNKNDFVEKRYEKFTRALRNSFEQQNDGSVFTRADRARIAMQLIKNELGVGDGTYQLSHWNIIQVFPVHDPKEQAGVIRDYMIVCGKKKNKDKIERMRQYYGERVAMYFAWLLCYNNALQWSCIFALPCFLFNVYHWLRPTGYIYWDTIVATYASILILWSSWYLVKWKRYRHTLTYLWNTEHIEEDESQRYEFTGTVKFNRVHGVDELWYPEWKRWIWRYPTSYFVTVCMLIVLFGVFVSMVAFKAAKVLGPYTNSVAGTISGVSIFILNAVYKVVAQKMNNLENHKTDRDWENGYIMKTFMFQFLNSYTSLYYIAFFKGKLQSLGIPPYLDQPCSFDDCAVEVATQLTFQFGTMIVIGQTLEVGMPLIKWGVKMLWAKGTKNKKANKLFDTLEEATRSMGEGGEPLNILSDELEVERQSAAYDVYDDYSEMVIQFGYVTLFTSLQPLAPMLALLNNFIEIRSDSAKMRFNQRPMPRRAKDIGKWAVCMDVLSYMALFTNVGLIVVYGQTHSRIAALMTGTDMMHENDASWQWWVQVASFFLVEHIFLMMKLFMEKVILPKENPRIKKQKLRLQYERNQELEKAAMYRRRWISERRHRKRRTGDSNLPEGNMPHAGRQTSAVSIAESAFTEGDDATTRYGSMVSLGAAGSYYGSAYFGAEDLEEEPHAENQAPHSEGGEGNENDQNV